ncbi:deoxyribose-phosphate aldolase [Clostridium sp. D2Q-11]|uniref:Deoxyribose-phosphate aldolase n=1 Tax=Anaeromonas frigoriresistens TaxID=2683708 RepID=A0A942ZAU1_9FIRM|nr:deoxyribose-phosphate aldolase [Anaeromonas frigoriresistens]MBS4540110.1 deoxyribose-phosphate aldolase [Anaeromonas frigoriresistens]
MNNIASMIDHTILKPDTTKEQVEKVCNEAREYNFASVCVNPSYVEYVAEQLKGSNVKVTSVVGFPLGSTLPEVKAFETKEAIKKGADEIDMVINIGELKNKNYDLVKEDIKAVVSASGDKLVKVIIEACLLTDEEKEIACKLSKEVGADYVKTSTGFSTGGATFEDVALMRKTVGEGLGVKASGGVRDIETAKKMVEAGATRIGASSSVAIVKGEKGNSDY